MPEVNIICDCCGLQLVIPDGASILDCPACGTRNARPCVTGPSLDILRHAVRQRLGGDFTNAERSYQQILLDAPDAHEALWGRLLCHYGIEYVEDPATKRLMPTVHTIRRKPLRTQPEFRDACAFAPEEIRARYEQDAAYIDDAQTAIRLAAASCPPYDVFICHKTTRPGSTEKTEDFHRAFQLFTYLEKQGLKPFFAPECLMGFAGADYEAGIYHALETAKVMLLIYSEKEYLTSAWVRSEWSRFIERIDDGADKRLIPLLYGNFDAYALPAEIRYRRIQGFPMGELTSTERLMTLLRDALGKPEPAPTPVQPAAPAPVQTAPVSPSPIPPTPVAAAPAPVEAPAPVKPAVNPAAARADYLAATGTLHDVSAAATPAAPAPAPAQAAASRPAADPAAAMDEFRAATVSLHARAMKAAPAKPAAVPAAPAQAIKGGIDDFKNMVSGASAPVRPATPAAPACAPENHFTAQRIFNDCSITKYTGPGGLVRIPPTIGGIRVTAISKDAFRNCKTLTGVIIPEGVTVIDDHAFRNCKSLATLVLPDTLVSIGKYAFAQNPALQRVILPERLQVIHKAAFWSCFALQEINIPANVDIRTDAFLLCPRLSRETQGWINTRTSLAAKLGFKS